MVRQWSAAGPRLVSVGLVPEGPVVGEVQVGLVASASCVWANAVCLGSMEMWGLAARGVAPEWVGAHVQTRAALCLSRASFAGLRARTFEVVSAGSVGGWSWSLFTLVMAGGSSVTVLVLAKICGLVGGGALPIITVS